ncbi:MAG: signal peptidase I [bacterium]|jgi:signal peptidase I
MRKIINLERFIKNKVAREWTEALIFAFLVALVFRTWLYAPFKVPTGSMHPTINVGDNLFANMHAYGFKIPFADKKLFAEKVKKGDIIIFPYPKDPSVDYIKRAIATGGDKIRIVKEKVYINGKLEKADFAYFDPTKNEMIGVSPDLTQNLSSEALKQCKPQYAQHVVNGRIYEGQFYMDCRITVPKGKIWAMGDNRRNSQDSRFWGFLDEKTVKGKAWMVYWSHNSNHGLFAGYQFNRIGTVLK